jgi:hypothetical protein
LGGGGGGSGSRFGGGTRLARFGGGGFGGFARGALGCSSRWRRCFGQVFFLLADGFGLGAASSSRRCRSSSSRSGGGFFDTGRRVVALDEDALLAHLHLDGARACRWNRPA